MFVIGDIIKGIFGDKGLTGGVLEVLKDTGIIKSPEDLLKAEQAIRDFEISKGNQNLETLKAELADISSARDMQKEALRQDDKFAKRFIYYFATFITVTTIAYVFIITFATIPEPNIRFADTVLGFLLGTLLATIINFFFGSSHGSETKTSIIAGLEKRR